MNTIEERLAALGTVIPDVLLPRPGVDLSKWAVIACDQFTQDSSYWEAVAKTVGDSPSTLNLIFPELYLGGDRREERIRAIHQSMASCLGDGVLSEPLRGCVYVERTSPHHQCRRGLVLAIDLERYDWRDSRTLIRSTEGTVPERLPPRMAIRRAAPLETPHILLLIDDEADYLIPALGERAKQGKPLYQTPLMLGAGAVSGWALDKEADWQALAEGLGELARRSTSRYGSPGCPAGEDPFLFAVGDGNHSLATAKAVWDEYKAAHPEGLEQHPARYALVEVENLYDPGIAFEPIHRAIFGLSLEEVLSALAALPGFSRRGIGNAEELARLTASPAPGNRYGLIGEGRQVLVETAATGIATEALQPLLDRLLDGQSGGAIDYIHGKDELFRIAGGAARGAASGEKPAVGILLPPVKKPGLFQTVAGSGPLPRKSFSMGEAEEKRFYLECRRLFR